MSSLGLTSLSESQSLFPRDNEIERLVIQRPLQRVLAFVGRSIDDVCSDPITKDLVKGYYKLHRQIQRSAEITELERWWNDG